MTRKRRMILAVVTLLMALTAFGVTTARGETARSGARHTASALIVSTCANFQLLIRPVRSSGAAGHLGVEYRLQNISNATCTLRGFPGVLLLDAKFSTLPTHLTWSTSLAGNHPVRLVTLAPRGLAYFVLYFPTIPTGSEPCPVAPYLMITPPNDRLPVVTYAGKGFPIRPCGGRLTATPIWSSFIPI